MAGAVKGVVGGGGEGFRIGDRALLDELRGDQPDADEENPVGLRLADAEQARAVLVLAVGGDRDPMAIAAARAERYPAARRICLNSSLASVIASSAFLPPARGRPCGAERCRKRTG